MNIKIMFTQGKDKRKNEFAEWHDGWNGVIFVDYAILTLPLGLGCDTRLPRNFTISHTHSTFDYTGVYA